MWCHIAHKFVTFYSSVCITQKWKSSESRVLNEISTMGSCSNMKPESEFLSGKAEQSQLHRELDSRSGVLKI